MSNFRGQIECRSDIDRLNAPFVALHQSLLPKEEEKKRQQQLLDLLRKHVRKEWPAASLYLFGSAANSLGLRNCDLDICLTSDKGFPYVDKCAVLVKLAYILRAANFLNVEAITRAKVPIVKCKDPVTGISCDISVNNVLAVINTRLLRHYADIDSRLRQLAMIVKHWAKSRGINKTYEGTLSSYAYVIMCIHFLQQRKPAILPCLQGMRKTFVCNVENTECSYYDKVENLHGFGSRNMESIAQLIWAFFTYWAYYHDHANDVISVRTGSILSKREKGWAISTRFGRHHICIEDPFKTSHDLGGHVDEYKLGVLKREFERAAFIMRYHPDPAVALFQS